MRPISSEVQHVRDSMWKRVDHNVRKPALGIALTETLRYVKNRSKFRVGNLVQRQLRTELL